MGFFNRGKAEREQSLAEVRREVGAIQKDIRELQDVVDELHAKHLRLRGTVYSYRLHKPPKEDEPAPATPQREMSRDELKRSLFHSGRFVPGKPAIHRETKDGE